MTQPEILQHVNPFLYTKDKPYKYRVAGVLGFVSTLLAGFGFYRFLILSPWYMVIFGPVVLIAIYNHALRDYIRMLRPDFSKQKHLKFVSEFWKENEQPSVAVFLPWCGESLAVYEQTLLGVSNLQYENKKVYLLDDKGDSGVKLLADKYGFVYLSRPNKGEYCKSGNLQYGWDNSKEEFAFILDSDFVPIPEALWHTMPYILSNSEMGILQTPQYFEQTENVHSRSPVEFGGGNIVEEFYDLDQMSRDRFDAAICVGTSAIYRRAAIMSVGGTPKVWGTEDVRTGMAITRGGYKVKYIPIIVSIGTSPDTMQDYFRQHNRWCSGSLQIMFDYYRRAKLSFMGRLIYLMNPLYYISEALVPILVFNFVALIAFQPNTIALWNSILFMPKILYELFVMPVIFRNHKTKIGSKLAAMNNVFTYFYTIFFDMPRKSKLLWHPAGVSIAGISKAFRNTIRVGLFFTSTYILTLTIVLIWRRQYLLNPQVLMVLLWSLYVAAWYMIYIYHATLYLKEHDTQYIHPTSRTRTHTRRVWAHVKHAVVPSLTVILFLSVYVNIYQLVNIKNSPSTSLVDTINTEQDLHVAVVASSTPADKLSEVSVPEVIVATPVKQAPATDVSLRNEAGKSTPYSLSAFENPVATTSYDKPGTWYGGSSLLTYNNGELLLQSSRTNKVAQTFLLGGSKLSNYAMVANIKLGVGLIISVFGHYQDQNNYIACEYSYRGSFVSLVQVQNGLKYTMASQLSDRSSQAFTSTDNRVVGISLSDTKASCLGMDNIVSANISNGPQSGTTGFGVLTPAQGAGSLTIQSVDISPL